MKMQNQKDLLWNDEGVKYVKAILKKKKLGELKSVQYKKS